MHSKILFWALALTTSQTIAGAVHPAVETATLVQRQDSCKDFVSRELAIPTPAPGLRAISACSVQFSEQSKVTAYADYHSSVARYFDHLESKLSSLSSATSCEEPFTTTYSNICTGNITEALVETSTGGQYTATVTNAIIRSSLALPTGSVVIDWAKVSKTSDQPAASATGNGDNTNDGQSRYNIRLGVAIGFTAVGCVLFGL
ncbi:unnamed protein product [Clonostachys rosea]|uniref:Ecp2 effector protein domain-containing protein n=1 Tax=Bionectria ochroleuca TaxID=29856 RepID=A0ABY6TVQ1_BIOOC|nr:unnamed protein product [Clonostachys rosea]